MAKTLKLIDLDECVINALTLFSTVNLPKLLLGRYKRPLVVGSGNAAVTGRVLFHNKDAVFVDEGSYKHALKTIKAIDGAILISASGGKHAPLIAKALKRKKLEVRLITNNKNAAAKKHVTKTFVFPKNDEPYTYNTSTYLGMILAKTKEKPQAILRHLKKVRKLTPKNLKEYDAFYIIVPEEYDMMREFLLTKFDELFGSHINGRVFTIEQTKHAKTVVPSTKELFISIGKKNTTFGKHRLQIPLYKGAGAGAFLATAYYVIGQIQKQHPPYFKKNIKAYAKRASKLFNQRIQAIVT